MCQALAGAENANMGKAHTFLLKSREDPEFNNRKCPQGEGSICHMCPMEDKCGFSFKFFLWHQVGVIQSM